MQNIEGTIRIYPHEFIIRDNKIMMCGAKFKFDDKFINRYSNLLYSLTPTGTKNTYYLETQPMLITSWIRDVAVAYRDAFKRYQPGLVKSLDSAIVVEVEAIKSSSIVGELKKYNITPEQLATVLLAYIERLCAIKVSYRFSKVPIQHIQLGLSTVNLSNVNLSNAMSSDVVISKPQTTHDEVSKCSPVSRHAVGDNNLSRQEGISKSKNTKDTIQHVVAPTRGISGKCPAGLIYLRYVVKLPSVKEEAKFLEQASRINQVVSTLHCKTKIAKGAYNVSEIRIVGVAYNSNGEVIPDKLNAIPLELVPSLDAAVMSALGYNLEIEFKGSHVADYNPKVIEEVMKTGDASLLVQSQFTYTTQGYKAPLVPRPRAKGMAVREGKNKDYGKYIDDNGEYVDVPKPKIYSMFRSPDPQDWIH